MTVLPNSKAGTRCTARISTRNHGTGLDESRPRCAAELRRQLKEMGFDVAEPGGEAKAEPVDDGIDWGLIETLLIEHHAEAADCVARIDRQLAAVRRKGATHA